MTAPLPLDVVLPAVEAALRDGAAGVLTPEVAVERALVTLRCADLTDVAVRCMECGNGSAFDPEHQTVLCGVGCGQPPRGDAVAGVQARWVDVVRRAQLPAAAPVTASSAASLTEGFATARLVDGDTDPGSPHIHRA